MKNGSGRERRKLGILNNNMVACDFFYPSIGGVIGGPEDNCKNMTEIRINNGGKYGTV